MESHVDCALNVFIMYPVGIWALVPSDRYRERLSPSGDRSVVVGGTVWCGAVHGAVRCMVRCGAWCGAVQGAVRGAEQWVQFYVWHVSWGDRSKVMFDKNVSVRILGSFCSFGLTLFLAIISSPICL